MIVNAGKVLEVKVGIDLRGGDVRVAEQFLHAARELADTRAEAAPGEWEKILIMGKQLAPEDPLFSGAGAVSSIRRLRG